MQSDPSPSTAAIALGASSSGAGSIRRHVVVGSGTGSVAPARALASVDDAPGTRQAAASTPAAVNSAPAAADSAPVGTVARLRVQSPSSNPVQIRSAAVAGSLDAPISAGLLPRLVQGLQSVDRVLTRMFDSAGAWVDGLPACGVTDLLQGALLLARNTWEGTYTGLMQRFGPALYHVPQYDHVVVVVLENHSFQEIRGIADTNQAPVPYLNDTLVPGGALMTASYGLQHPSQPNYYWLFSGSNQGITTDAPVISNGINTVNSTASNLYTELQSLPTPKSFGGYVEGYTGPVDFGIPSGTFSFTGTIASANGAVGEIDNVERHVPWAGFANVPQDVTASFTSFGPDYSALPDVSFVIPALQHDMHNYGFGDAEVSDVATSDTAMANSDAWLQQNIDGYAQWARTHNSLLIITTDEDSSADWLTPPLTSINYGGPSGSSAIAAGAPGFTSAAEGPSADANNASGAAQSGANQIFTLFYGAYVVPGEYSNPITNVNVLRTVEASMGISTKAGAQPDFAGTTASGAHDPSYPFNDAAVTNVFSIGCR